MHEAKLQIYVIQITGFIGGTVGHLSHFLWQDVTKNADVTEFTPTGVRVAEIIARAMPVKGLQAECHEYARNRVDLVKALKVAMEC